MKIPGIYAPPMLCWYCQQQAVHLKSIYLDLDSSSPKRWKKALLPYFFLGKSYARTSRVTPMLGTHNKMGQ
jgi:hypothetical protein